MGNLLGMQGMAEGHPRDIAGQMMQAGGCISVVSIVTVEEAAASSGGLQKPSSARKEAATTGADFTAGWCVSVASYVSGEKLEA